MVDFEKPYTIEHFQKDRQTCMTFQTKDETTFDALKLENDGVLGYFEEHLDRQSMYMFD